AEIVRARGARADGGAAATLDAEADRIARLSYAEILETRVAFGTAAGLIARLTELRESLELDGVVAELNPGGLLSLEQMQRTLRALTHEVMPAFR
ncbi:MAG TPA: hypothetical protein VFX28_05600, partial [Methylomirabilota bacterium]|nr:hypothetical protein [Methylomirabilota bacterium]